MPILRSYRSVWDGRREGMCTLIVMALALVPWVTQAGYAVRRECRAFQLIAAPRAELASHLK